jgi:hypothetical protein
MFVQYTEAAGRVKISGHRDVRPGRLAGEPCGTRGFTQQRLGFPSRLTSGVILNKLLPDIPRAIWIAERQIA